MVAIHIVSSMTKNERISIENANLVIIIGADFEPWAHKIRKVTN